MPIVRLVLKGGGSTAPSKPPVILSSTGLGRTYFPLRGLPHSIVVHAIAFIIVYLFASFPVAPPKKDPPRENIVMIDLNDPLSMMYLPVFNGGIPPKSGGRAIQRVSKPGRSEASNPPSTTTKGFSYPGQQLVISDVPEPTNRFQTILQPEIENPPVLVPPILVPNVVQIADAATASHMEEPPAEPEPEEPQPEPKPPEPTPKPEAQPKPAPAPVAAPKPVETPKPAPPPPDPKPEPKLPEPVIKPVEVPKVEHVPVPAPKPEPKPVEAKPVQTPRLEPKIPEPAPKLTETPKPEPKPAESAPETPKPQPKPPEPAPKTVEPKPPEAAPKVAEVPKPEPKAAIPTSKPAETPKQEAKPQESVLKKEVPKPEPKPSQQADQAPAAGKTEQKNPETVASTGQQAMDQPKTSESADASGAVRDLLSISPMPAPPGPAVRIPPGEARGRFVISPQPNLNGSDAEPGFKNGTPASDVGVGNTTGAPARKGVAPKGAPVTSAEKAPASGVSRGGKSGPGGTESAGGSGRGSGTVSSPGTGNGNGLSSGAGTAKKPFAGITIVGGEYEPGSDSDAPQVKQAVRPLQTAYGLSVISTENSGGGLPFYGVFSHEQIYTVYLDMRTLEADPDPSWTLEFAVSEDSSSAATVRNVGQGMVLPFPSVKEKPAWPAGLAHRYPGKMIVVYGVVNTSGKLEQVSIKESPDAQLNEPVIRALSKWVFRPATLEGQMVPAKVLMGIPIWAPE